MLRLTKNLRTFQAKIAVLFEHHVNPQLAGMNCAKSSRSNENLVSSPYILVVRMSDQAIYLMSVSILYSRMSPDEWIQIGRRI